MFQLVAISNQVMNAAHVLCREHLPSLRLKMMSGNWLRQCL